LAIRELNADQTARIQAAATAAGIIGGGIHGWIAALVGMPTPSTLADMMSGRTPGYRYHSDLATQLGVRLEWLQGDDRQAPDWSLSPLDAWERFAGKVETHWHRLGQVRQRGDDTASEAHVAPADEHRVARLLGLPLGHADLTRLAGGRLAACDFDVVVRFAVQLGQKAPIHSEHLRRGHEIARLVENRLEQALKTARRRYARFLLPPRLFQAARLALIGLKAQRAYQGRDQQVIDDCLEVLWRQQHLRRGDARPIPLEQFMRETSRSAWTPLTRLNARYPEEADFAQTYDSRSS